MQQPQRPMPNPFAAFALVAARAGLGALGGATTSSKGKKKDVGGCTPCAAQARKDAAQAFVRGMRGGGG